MFRMTRLILFLAATALAAAPSAARAQPGASPSRPVDECGKPAAATPRRGTPRPTPSSGTPAAGAAAAAQGPRLLGTPAGRSAAGSSASGAQSIGTAASTGTPPNSASTPAAGSTAAGAQSTAATAGTGHPQSAGSSATAAASTGTTGGTNPQQGAYSATAATTQASSTSVETARSSTSAGSQFLSSGDRTIDPRAAKRNRDALRLGLSELGDRKRLGPAASVSVPTAFGVDGGEMFFGVAYQGRTRFTDEDDAAAVIGIGIGTRRAVAVEAAVTTYSTIRSYPLETGGLSVKVHRALPAQTSVAVGWENAVTWGGSDDDGSLYGAVTKLMTLRAEPDAPFSSAVFTLGLGNGRFRFEDDDRDDRQTVNLFAAAGARVTPQVSLVADWTGQDLNAAASLTPLRHIPVVVTVGLADLTGTAGDGARFILSLGYGLAFRQPF